MASYFNLTLDTTAPSSCSISAPARANTVNINLTLGATSASYMKVWGDICATAGGDSITESNASWVAYNTTLAVILTATNATKTIYAKFKDDVGNESASVSATTILDTTAPVVTITGPDVSKISKISGYDTAEFSFSANEVIKAWKVKVVPSTSSIDTAGTQIPTTAGSTNMSGSTETSAETAITCTIKGADLEAASSGDGAKIIKVFVQDMNDNWSI